MKIKCKPGHHVDSPLKRGSKRVQCEICKDEFPCRSECEHLDCMVATNRALPDWVGDNALDAIRSELAIITPNVLTTFNELATRVPFEATVLATSVAPSEGRKQYRCTECGELGHNARKHKNGATSK